MKHVDDRTTVRDMAAFPVLIVGTDTFLSGWGEAERGLSVAAWACREEDADRVEAWVEARSDMRNVERTDDTYTPPEGCMHFHVYKVDKGHPALRG